MNNKTKLVKRKKSLKKQFPFFIMMAPGIFFITLLCYIPMGGVIIAFKDYNPVDGILGSKFMDPLFKNFEFFFKSDTAKNVTFNTLSNNVIQAVLITVCAVAVAIALNELNNKFFKGVFKGAILLPTFLSWVVVQYILFSFLSVDRGIVNNVLGMLGLQEVDWYSDPTRWRIIMPLAYLWKNIGYYSVLYGAAIAGINTDYYEAAQLDGAGKWQQIKSVTLPLIRPTIIVLSLLWVGKLFNGGLGDWNAYYTLTNNAGSLYKSTDVIDTYVYRSLKTVGDYGMTAAVGLYQSTVGFFLVLITNKVIKKIDPDSALF